jgi:alpha-beta hydrolase superfamily lysophospholipase
MTWKLEQRDEIGFDGETHSEYVYQVPVAAKEGRRDRLEFHELIEYVNRLEDLALDLALGGYWVNLEQVEKMLKDTLEGESSNG